MKSAGSAGHDQPEFFWPKAVMRKWLNISAKDSDYGADTDGDDDDDDNNTTEEEEEDEDHHHHPHVVDHRDDDLLGDLLHNRRRSSSSSSSRCNNNNNIDIDEDNDRGGRGRQLREAEDTATTLLMRTRRRRRKSETFRAQYINIKELSICVGTWNVGGKLPPDDLDIEEWIDFTNPADIYVIGLQEIVPLNAGNIFGAEDNRPVPKWEKIIRQTLNKIRHRQKTNIKCYSDPPSPSKVKPFDFDLNQVVDHLSLNSTDDEDDPSLHVVDEPTTAPVLANPQEDNIHMPSEQDFQRQFSSANRQISVSNNNDREKEEEEEESGKTKNRRLTRSFSKTERIGLSWPEPPLDLLARHGLERPSKSFTTMKSSEASNCFRAYTSFKLFPNDGMPLDIQLLAELNLEALLLKRKRKSAFVRIVSKQMVGVFLSIWVRRSLRGHIQNVKVSNVGVGIMGYHGNKGSISVSMSIYQTPFCFICTHLTSGEKDGDEIKRNADVHEISKRTHFQSSMLDIAGLTKSIHDHERIIWLGDLNYRINMSYENTQELICSKEWSKLADSDQLRMEMKKGNVFEGWSEGSLNFGPTYKYEDNSDKYCGEDGKASGRRTPAWCDRILCYGKGMRLVSYRRNENRLSDHRPVTATYMAEVEVFSPRKLQRALTFTNAEINNGDIDVIDDQFQ